MNALLALTPTAAAVYDNINAAHSPDQLENVARVVWHHYSKNELGDAEATFLSGAIEKRKPQQRAPIPLGGVGQRNVASRFTPRPCRRRLTDDERTARRRRKRVLGGSSALPDTMRGPFTEGERAAMCIVAGEVKRTGVCVLSIDEIGDRAGVGRTTVQNAMHEARRLGLLRITERRQRGAKNKPNMVEITSAEWLAWIKRAPSAARSIGSKTPTLSKNVNTLKNIDIKIDRDSGEHRSTGAPGSGHRRALQGTWRSNPRRAEHGSRRLEGWNVIEAADRLLAAVRSGQPFSQIVRPPEAYGPNSVIEAAERLLARIRSLEEGANAFAIDVSLDEAPPPLEGKTDAS